MFQETVLKMWEERRYVLANILGAAALGLVLAIVFPPRYVSTSRIIPPQQVQSSLGAIMGQMGAIGFSGLGALRFPSDVYVQLLRSDTVARAMIDRFSLANHYKLDTFEDIRKRLESRSYIRGSRDGVVAIRVTDRESEMAASLANGYVEELYKAIQRLALEEATQRREFVEAKLIESKNELRAKEADFRAMQEKLGIVKVDGQVDTTYATMGALRGAVAAREVSLRALSSWATAQNPVYRNIEAEIAALKEELRKVEQSPSAQDPKFVIAAERAPELYMEYVRKLRELRFEEGLYQAMQRQYELIRMEETKDFQQFLVVDVARPATKAEFPTPLVIVLMSTVAGLAFGVYQVLSDRRWKPSALWKKPGESSLKDHAEL
jgi:uncharacterized protein involved in exopolysaccharide biosynthesis